MCYNTHGYVCKHLFTRKVLLTRNVCGYIVLPGGFGTLDEDSLRSAVSVLSSLATGGRLVGVISHVAELKEKVDKQILVEKSRAQGSTLRVKF